MSLPISHGRQGVWTVPTWFIDFAKRMGWQTAPTAVPVGIVWRPFLMNTLAFATYWALLVFLLLWLVRLLRRPSHPSCPTCGYNLEGLATGSPCPECGRLLAQP